MADKTKIEWADASWTPIRARNRKTGKLGWHCEHVSPGCANCYAEGLNQRLGTGLPFKPGHRADVELFLDEAMLTQPLRWKKPRMIFVCSMTDLFADFVPDAMIDRIFAVMALCPQHTFQVLTKRPKRMRAYMAERWQPAPAQDFKLGAETIRMDAEGEGEGRQDQVREASEPFARQFKLCDLDNDAHWDEKGNCKAMAFAWPLPNVWLGTSGEDQPRADERIPELLATPAAVRFVSLEPLLGAIDITPYLFIYTHADDAALAADSGPPPILPFHDPSTTRPEDIATPPLDWVIAGGESGPRARPMHPNWARSIRDQCAAAGVAFFFKQLGEWKPDDSAFVRILEASHDVAWPDGTLGGGRAEEHGGEGIGMHRVGKKAAGRLLDGVAHSAFPEAPR